MKRVGFLILFVINLFGVSSKGQVLPQSSMKTYIPGSTVRLNWTFPGDPFKAALAWYFTRRRVGSKEEEIALKYRNNPAIIFNSSLPQVAIELTPATLVLKNVDERYNGKYRFNIQAVSSGEAKVELYIAVKPNVTINCLSLIKLNESDDFTCLCRGEGGNPPADVTWFRNGTQLGETRTENNTLTRTNVDETDNVTYTCLAQSYPDPIFEDSKTVVVQVKFKPKETTIEFTQNPAKLGTSVTIMCKSRGFPEPSYTITLNGTKTVSTEKTHTTSMVGLNDTGTYNCTATNERGSHWAAKVLVVTEQAPTTSATSTPEKSSSTTSTTKKVTTTDDGERKAGLSTGHIIGIVIVALLLVGLTIISGRHIKKKGQNVDVNGLAVGPAHSSSVYIATSAI